MPAGLLEATGLPGDGAIIVAFSGGPDSVCLLHLLVHADTDRPIRCIHVDHGLDNGSAVRATRAAGIANEIGASCRIVRVEVASGQGPEAEARRARYRALAAEMDDGDLLVTAHHSDDQVETILLRMIRGAGPEGLAGIPPRRRFGAGWLDRPLLDWSRDDIERWLDTHALPCIRDPANEQPGFDRNHLRHDILPALRKRWPGVDAALLRSARLCAGAAGFIASRVACDLEAAASQTGHLDLERLSDAGAYYRGEVLRAWCLREGVPPPPGRRLEAFLGQMASASGDRCPELRWDDAIMRSWRRRCWLQQGEEPGADWHLDWDGRAPLDLPGDLGQLVLLGDRGQPLPLSVAGGRSGDAIRLAPNSQPRSCNRLLADAGVPPWQRPQWPRIHLAGQLVALGDAWLADDFRKRLQASSRDLAWRSLPRRMIRPGLESGS